MEFQIIPVPQKQVFTPQRFNLGKDILIRIKDLESDDLKNISNYLVSAVWNKHGFELSVVDEPGDSSGINLIVDKDFTLSDDKNTKSVADTYKLLITKNAINIYSASNRGLFYGVNSLIQIIENSSEAELPGMEILDWPDMPVRGISDDISRGQVSTLENFKRILDFMARYKLNIYMPYMEDMIQFDTHPSIGKNRGALTKDEIREIISYAKRRYIEVIPVFQTLGHYENILSMTQYLEYAEFPGAGSLDVSLEKTYVFLEELLKEVFELFPSPYFNMGADESYDVGLYNSRGLVEKSDIATVHAQHYNRVYEICRKYNKKVMMYGDIILNHPKILEMIPKDIKIVDWHYEAADNYPSASEFSNAGFNYYVSPSVANYQTVFPDNVVAIPNIKYFIKSGLENNAGGMINSNWGDFGAETFKEFVLFGYAWSAQCSWNYNQSDIANFSRDFFVDFLGDTSGSMEQIFRKLSDPANRIGWHDFWRHPLLPFRANQFLEAELNSVEKIEWNNWSLQTVKKGIPEPETKLSKNFGMLELFDFIIDLNSYYKNKVILQLELFNYLNGQITDSQHLIDNINTAISEIENLKGEYSRLWLKYYKHENLNMIMDKFDRSRQYLEEIVTGIRSGGLKSPEIESDWIYAGNSESERSSKTSFKTSFHINGEIIKGTLQLLGDTHVRLFINGEFVTDVHVRRSLSLFTEFKRIKFLDITQYLKPGQNSVEAIVCNYNAEGNAGLNIIAEIIFDSGTFTLRSNSEWLAKPAEVEHAKWEQSSVKEYPNIVVAPNFKTGRTSWIER